MRDYKVVFINAVTKILKQIKKQLQKATVEKVLRLICLLLQILHELGVI